MQSKTPTHILLNQESQCKQTWKTPSLPPLVPLLCSSRMLLYHPGTPKRALNQCSCSEGIVLTPCNNAFPLMHRF